jgi:hypothetical protein
VVERTEDLGLAGVLPLTVGGARRDVPVLSIEQSERWLRHLGTLAEGITMPERLGDLFTVLGPRLVDAVATYETFGACPEICPDRSTAPGPEHAHAGVLGGEAEIRRRMTKRELRDAFEAMVLAENPFATDLRSVVEASGPQLRAMVPLLVATLAERLVQANWRPTLSGSGDSTPPLSGDGSPGSSSSSSPGTTSADDTTNGGSAAT